MLSIFSRIRDAGSRGDVLLVGVFFSLDVFFERNTGILIQINRKRDPLFLLNAGTSCARREMREKFALEKIHKQVKLGLIVALELLCTLLC